VESRRNAASPERAGREMSDLQEALHSTGHDYEPGSPHLRHSELRGEIVRRIRTLVAEQFALSGRCRVLEVGAGHGGFTDHVAAMGADVTVTEMSRPSLDVLKGRFGANPKVRLVYDADGETALNEASTYDLVLCISVLHHIPDYLDFVHRVVEKIAPGGAFASFQDPLWYPRRNKANLAADRVAFYAWRLGRADRFQGISNRIRRARGHFDESKPSDMVEYHVLRQGVDEEALAAQLREGFATVELWRYWSTQSRLLQTVGARAGVNTTFGLAACGRT
jgi:2-polyprenyl-3-methyl-5-hydroxy-6-metoxy-1,4-benzoquinol methylase